MPIGRCRRSNRRGSKQNTPKEPQNDSSQNFIIGIDGTVEDVRNKAVDTNQNNDAISGAKSYNSTSYTTIAHGTLVF